MTPMFYLVIVLLLPGVTPKAEDAKIETSITMVQECPDKEVFKNRMEEMAKTGEILHYDISCIIAPPVIDHDPEKDGEPT